MTGVPTCGNHVPALFVWQVWDEAMELSLPPPLPNEQPLPIKVRVMFPNPLPHIISLSLSTCCSRCE